MEHIAEIARRTLPNLGNVTRDYSTVLNVIVHAESDEAIGTVCTHEEFTARIVAALETDPANFSDSTKRAVQQFLASPPQSARILREQIKAMVSHEVIRGIEEHGLRAIHTHQV
jgi:hypothetical protein